MQILDYLESGRPKTVLEIAADAFVNTVEVEVQLQSLKSRGLAQQCSDGWASRPQFTEEDLRLFAKYEAAARGGKLSTGQALRCIEELNLYRIRNVSFDEYCREHWSISGHQARNLIDYARFYEKCPMSNKPSLREACEVFKESRDESQWLSIFSRLRYKQDSTSHLFQPQVGQYVIAKTKGKSLSAICNQPVVVTDVETYKELDHVVVSWGSQDYVVPRNQLLPVPESVRSSVTLPADIVQKLSRKMPGVKVSEAIAQIVTEHD